MQVHTLKMTHNNSSTPDELQDARLAAAERFADLGKLSAGILHDLKNPITYVTNLSEMSLDLVDELEEMVEDWVGEGEDEGFWGDLKDTLSLLRENMERLQKQGNLARRLVKTSLSAVRGGDEKPEQIQLDSFLEDWVQMAYAAERAAHPEFQCEIEVLVNEEVATVAILTVSFQRVLLNLLHNAFYAMRAKKAQEEDFEPQLFVSARGAEGTLLLTLQDNGVGIPEEDLEHVFDAFFTTKAVDGTGLGLYMTREAVENVLNGSIEMESKAGQYTRFLIQIPV